MTRIWDLPMTEEGAVSFFQEIGVLPKNAICDQNHEMKLSFSEGVRWRCNLSTCRTRRSIRNGTWFESFRLSFLTSLRFIYCWSEEMTSVKWCQKQLGMNHNTVVDWNNYLREVCVEVLAEREQNKIGGPEKIVEIDESLFTKRRNIAGRILPQEWIFGGVCRQTDECFLIKIPNRSLPVLLEAITNYIEEGSIVYADSWQSYCTSDVDEASLQHFKANHTYNFVDPDSGVNTQKIERLWGTNKWRKRNSESYLAEFMWRRRASDPFEQILHDISVFWKNQKL